MIESAVTLLPDPDSPTIPRVSPSSRVKDTPSTAFTTPSGVKNWVLRFLTCSSSAINFHFPVPKCHHLPEADDGIWAYFLLLGSSASLMPSPRKLKAKRVTARKRLGKMIR